MTQRPEKVERGPKPDVAGFLVLLVLATLVGAALIPGVRFLPRWLEAASPG